MSDSTLAAKSIYIILTQDDVWVYPDGAHAHVRDLSPQARTEILDWLFNNAHYIRPLYAAAKAVFESPENFMVAGPELVEALEIHERAVEVVLNGPVEQWLGQTPLVQALRSGMFMFRVCMN